MDADDIPVELSSDQASELLQLTELYGAALGDNLENPAVWFGHHVRNYLRALVLAAEIETQRQQQLQLQDATGSRRNSLQAFESYLGRTPSARDILTEVSRIVTLPPYIAEAIQHDIERLRRQ